MLKFVLLLFAVAGFNARPLQYNDLRIQNGGWVIGAPQLVQDGQEYMGYAEPAKHPRQDPKSEPQWEVVLAPPHPEKMRTDLNQKVAPIEEQRQDTEPSKRYVVDLNTGLLKEYVVYNPASNPEFRQGTQNSRVTLVNIRTGQQLPELTEMQRRAEPLSEFRQGTEYSEPTLRELKKSLVMRSMDKSNVNKQEETHKSYNPASNPEFRQGTQDSRVTLVNIRTGQLLPQLTEMQRRAEPLSEFRQGTEYSEPTLRELKKSLVMRSMDKSNVNKQEETHKSYNPASNPEFRQGTQDSRVTLVNIRTGQLLPQLTEMQRRAEPLSEFRQGTEYSEPTLRELKKSLMMRSMDKSNVNKQEETHKSYNPASNPEFRQGTQDSRVTLVNIRTGQLLPQLTEMQRRAEPFEFKQGTEFSLVALKYLRKTQKLVKTPNSAQDTETNEVYPEFKRGIQYSQAQRQNIMDQQSLQALESNEVDISSTWKEFRHGKESSHDNIIGRSIMEPSYVKQNGQQYTVA